ncbi:uncharacterized protein [Epargyreus clarus]|uniref:uncharacterized protein n=1 Tax=Epargyreus clarus TaxID=520877 RepID=UPI003C2C1C52
MGSISYLTLLVVILTRSNCESSEEQHQFAYGHAYAPHSVDFHDIYPHGNAILPEETPSTTDEDFRLNTISTQFVEFHPRVLKIQPITPPPKIVLNASYLKLENTTLRPTTTTPEPDDRIKLVKMRHYQRGVLDLLLPASRVRNFKNVFDTFRRMLSYTFKKR